MPQYRTKEGDAVDDIAWRHYGRQDVIDQVLSANPGLAALGGSLPSGLLIELPEVAVELEDNRVKLWD